MNLVPATLTDGRDGRVVRLPFLEFPARATAAALAGCPAGTELLVGIRPHDLRPQQDPPQGPSFAARVRLTEPLGDITVIDVAAGDAVLQMVLSEEAALGYAAGDELRIELPLAETHLFFRDTGVAIN
jgi:multiple sugar transport system ATP-binding protein